MDPWLEGGPLTVRFKRLRGLVENKLETILR